MQDPMPHFKYRFVDIFNRRVPCIEAGGKIIHEIRYLDEFYRMFGYMPEISRSGILPDEFIWAEYINHSAADFSHCIQMHIIEYLRKHSDTFRKEYGDRYEEWVAAHSEARQKSGAACIACTLKQCRKD